MGRTKGRAVPPLLPPVQRAQLIIGAVTLADGRVLRYQGQRYVEVPSTQPQATPLFVHMAWWLSDDEMKVIASMDPTPHGMLLHVSISYADHAPTWEEIRHVREVFYPLTVDVMMVLPQQQDYVNLHEYCFHLWQTPIEWGIR